MRGRAHSLVHNSALSWFIIVTPNITMTSSNLSRIEEGAPVDDGAIKHRPQAGASRLSITSAKFDLDGDGVLNEAELASKL